MLTHPTVDKLHELRCTGRNGPRELDSVVSEIFLGFQAAKSR